VDDGDEQLSGQITSKYKQVMARQSTSTVFMSVTVLLQFT